MKKQFQIKIYKDNIILSYLSQIIAQHNSNEFSEFPVKHHELTLDDIHGYVKTQKYHYNSLRNLISEVVMDELVVMVDGENVSFIIEEKVMVELEKEETA